LLLPALSSMLLEIREIDSSRKNASVTRFLYSGWPYPFRACAKPALSVRFWNRPKLVQASRWSGITRCSAATRCFSEPVRGCSAIYVSYTTIMTRQDIGSYRVQNIGACKIARRSWEPINNPTGTDTYSYRNGATVDHPDRLSRLQTGYRTMNLCGLVWKQICRAITVRRESL